MKTLQLPKSKISLDNKIHYPLSSHLPTFKPHDEYIGLLVMLQKEKNRGDKQDKVKVKNLSKRLSIIETTLTSEEIICNNRIAYANIKPTKI